jgi:hypothetical protein
MSRHDAHGISVELPEGWNGMIYRRRDEDEDEPAAAGRRAVRGGATLRASTVPVDFDDADFGSGIVERLGPDDSMVILFEYTADERLVPGEGLFAEQGEPWPLDPNAFHRRALQVNLSGQAGLQRFFTVGGRPFCVYVVVGSARRVATTVRGVNDLLATVRIAARS